MNQPTPQSDLVSTIQDIAAPAARPPVKTLADEIQEVGTVRVPLESEVDPDCLKWAKKAAHLFGGNSLSTNQQTILVAKMLEEELDHWFQQNHR